MTAPCWKRPGHEALAQAATPRPALTASGQSPPPCTTQSPPGCCAACSPPQCLQDSRQHDRCVSSDVAKPQKEVVLGWVTGLRLVLLGNDCRTAGRELRSHCRSTVQHVRDTHHFRGSRGVDTSQRVCVHCSAHRGSTHAGSAAIQHKQCLMLTAQRDLEVYGAAILSLHSVRRPPADGHLLQQAAGTAMVGLPTGRARSMRWSHATCSCAGGTGVHCWARR